MKTDLTILDNKIPIRSIPDDELNRIILTDFLTWVGNLLSLTDEVSANRLETSLPAIKEHCWSMGFDEIKKMFEMYADSKLSLKPMPNYFDRILLGKIVEAYRQTKRTKPQTMDETERKRQQDNFDAINHYDSFVSNRKLEDNAIWVYSFLEFRGIIADTKKDKVFNYNLAMQQTKNNEKQAIELAKKSLLRKFFERIEAKGTHLKDLL